MTNISVYDDTARVIERIEDVLGESTAEVIDYLLDNLDSEVAEELVKMGVKFL